AVVYAGKNENRADNQYPDHYQGHVSSEVLLVLACMGSRGRYHTELCPGKLLKCNKSNQVFGLWETVWMRNSGYKIQYLDKMSTPRTLVRPLFQANYARTQMWQRSCRQRLRFLRVLCSMNLQCRSLSADFPAPVT